MKILFPIGTAIAVGAIGYASTGSAVAGFVLGGVSFLLTLPPNLDPAFRIKKKQTKPQDDGRTAQERSDIAAINKGICPDCGAHGSLLAGPSGGMSQNVACNSCLMEFNVHFGFGQGSLSVDRTGIMSESRARVFGIQAEEFASIQPEAFRSNPNGH